MHLHSKARPFVNGNNEFSSFLARLVRPHAAPDQSSIQAHKDSLAFPVDGRSRLSQSKAYWQWQWWQSRVNRQALAAGRPAAARHRQRDRVIAGKDINMTWTSRRAVQRDVPEVPIPGRDRASGLVGELHGQWHTARSRAG